MSTRTLRIRLPIDSSDDHITPSHWACVRLLGKDLRSHLEPVLTATYGPDWPTQLQALYGHGQRAEANDTALLLKEALRPGHRASRAVLPTDRRWLDAAETVIKMRNVLSHGAESVLDQAIADARTLTYLTTEAGLRCAQECTALLERLIGLQDGTWRQEDEATDGRVPDAEAMANHLAAVQAVADQQAEQLEQANNELAKRDAEIAALRADHQRRDAETQAAHDAALALAQREADKAHADARAAKAQAKAARAQAKAAQEQAANVVAQHPPTPIEPATPAVSESRPAPTVERNLDQLLDRLNAIHAAALDRAQEDTDELPRPGQPWPYELGTDRWKLSKQYQRLTRADGTDLSDLVGARRATELVQQFLTIRPTGGKVFVDADHDAATFCDGQWIYLGRLERNPDRAALRPGAVMPDGGPGGTRYTMTADGRLTRSAGGKDLSQVLGAARSAAVIDRIRQVKPSGGRLRVDKKSGIVSAWVGDDVVYVTTVRPEEWFPGHLN